MIVETFHDAILVEIGNRLNGNPTPIQPCTCSDNYEKFYIQRCECLAEPDVDSWKCSDCGTPYEEGTL